jgi:putative hemolysin
MTSLGQVPRVGDSFELNGFKFEVVDMDGKRIDKVLVMRTEVEQVLEVRRNFAVGGGQ